MHSDDLLPGDTPLRLIDEEGSGHPHEHHPFPTADRLVDGYRRLVLGRRLNEQADALVRQASSRSTRRRTGRRPPRSRPRSCSASRTGCSRPIATPSP